MTAICGLPQWILDRDRDRSDHFSAGRYHIFQEGSVLMENNGL